MEKSPSIAELAKALAAAQAEMQNPQMDETAEVPTRTGGKFTYKYASLPSVRDAVFPVLAKHGLSLTQWPTTVQGGIALHSLLMHTSGEYIWYDPLELPVLKNDAQACGSAVTYSRRYTILPITGVVAEEDDDAQAAVAAAPRRQRTAYQARAQTQMGHPPEQPPHDPHLSARLREDFIKAISATQNPGELQDVKCQILNNRDCLTHGDDEAVRAAYQKRKTQLEQVEGI